MTQRLITDLPHGDLAGPDFARQLDFYSGTWGLTTEHTDTGLAFLAAVRDLTAGAPVHLAGPDGALRSSL